jgi:hypothetical protein
MSQLLVTIREAMDALQSEYSPDAKAIAAPYKRVFETISERVVVGG